MPTNVSNYKIDSIDCAALVEWRKNGLTYSEISSRLQQDHPFKRGFSERSVWCYCKEHSIEIRYGHEIDKTAGEAVLEVYACRVDALVMRQLKIY